MSIAISIILILYGLLCGMVLVNAKASRSTTFLVGIFFFLSLIGILSQPSVGDIAPISITLNFPDETLQDLNALAMVFLTCALVALTTGLFWVGKRQSDDNRILRKAGTEPNVVGFIHSHEDSNAMNFFMFKMKNVGKGTAKNIVYSVEGDVEMLKANGMVLPCETDRSPLPMLPPEESISTFWGDIRQMLNNTAIKPFTIKITCTNLEGEEFVTRSTIDISSYKGFGRIGNEPLYDIASTLKKVEQKASTFNQKNNFLLSEISRLKAENNALKRPALKSTRRRNIYGSN